jgi:hypothetical protein
LITWAIRSLTGSWRAVFRVGGAPALLALWIDKVEVKGSDCG